MLAKFGEKTGEGLAAEMLIRLLTPAGIFWAGGLAAWASRLGFDGLRRAGRRFADLPAVLQITVVLAVVVAVLVSAVVAQKLSLPLLRLLEGYWPGRTAERSVRRLHARRARDQRQAVLLEQSRRRGDLTAGEARDLARLQARLRDTPGSLDQTMPTRLGNRLRAAELRPKAKHGLDVVACWPHLWLVMDDSTRAELIHCRTELDSAVRAYWWSLALVVWTPFAWWEMPLGLLLAVLVYHGWLLGAARDHGDLTEAAFDLYSTRLYTALGWTPPARPDPAKGEELARYLWQGLAPGDV